MLNPKKFVFDVSSGKLLGYMVSSQCIDANPTKVEAIEKLRPPRTRKEIQKLVGIMVALSQSPMMCYCYMWQPLTPLSALLSSLSSQKPQWKSSNSRCTLLVRFSRMLKQDTHKYRSYST
jgi:hypothetical protein